MYIKKCFFSLFLIVLFLHNLVITKPKTMTVNPVQSRPNVVTTQVQQPIQSNVVTTQVQQPIETTVVTTKVQRPVEPDIPGLVKTHESAITDTAVMIKNNSADKMSFALAAIHTTYEKTPMFSRAYNMYVTQSIVSDLVDVNPYQTITSLNVNNDGKELLERERTFAIVIIAVRRTSDEQVKKTCVDNQNNPLNAQTAPLSPTPQPGAEQPVLGMDANNNVIVLGYTKNLGTTQSNIQVCQVFDMELTVTEHVSTWISNARVKKVLFKSPPVMGQANVFEFPADFIFDKTEDTTHTTPNYQKIIDMMKEVEKKYNKMIFPSHYFKKETLQQLPLKEISNVSAYAYNMLTKPLPVTQATLGTLLDCGKYNGIAIALVKIAMAVILAITGGAGAFSLIEDIVSGGMEIGSQAKDLKARS